MRKLRDIFNNFNPLQLSWLENRKIRLILGTIIIFIISAIIASIDFLPEQISIEAGQVAETDISAPRTINYINQEETERVREQAAGEVEDYYRKDVTILAEVENEIAEIFNVVANKQDRLVKTAEDLTELEIDRAELDEYNFLDSMPEEELIELREELQAEIELDLSAEEAEYLLLKEPADLEALKEDVLALVSSYLNEGIKEGSELDQVKREIEQDVLRFSNGSNGTNLYNITLEKIVVGHLRANMFFDEQQTEQLREQARSEVEPVQRTIMEGETIVRQGSVANEEDIKILEALGILQPEIDYFNILGLVAVVGLFFLITIFYILNYQPEILDDEGIFYLLGLMPIFMLILAQAAKYLSLEYPVFVIPIATASIIIAILVNTNLALIFTVVLSFLIAMVTGGDLIGGAVLVISGITGIYSVTKLSQRSDLVRAGFIVGGVTSVAIVVLMLANPLIELKEVLFYLPFGMINGLVVAILVNGMLPYIENLFGVTSPVKLLELSNPRHPLLKRLLMEAPGTYHHSIIVGNLAEAAADEVGADSLLTRVGAYYHDIGKVKRSYFFTENQIGGENPHDKLSPNLSTLIITSHVKDGVELATEYKLPQIIVNIIKQHHGTSLVSFFYQEAMYDEKYENVDEDDFRYEGPKPQTKESALLMLADIVEAAVRSNVSVQSNPGKLEAFVRKLIKDKLNSGQLDESDLTLKDLDKVAESFISILKGIFHNRVEYPDNVAEQLKGAKK